MCSDNQHNGKYFYFRKQGRKHSDTYFEVFSSPEDIFYLLIYMFVAALQWSSQCKIQVFNIVVNIMVVQAFYSVSYKLTCKHFAGS